MILSSYENFKLYKHNFTHLQDVSNGKKWIACGGSLHYRLIYGPLSRRGTLHNLFVSQEGKFVNIYKFPVGKHRMQPVGITVFATMMATSGFQLLFQVIHHLLKQEPFEKMNSEELFWLYSTMEHFFDMRANIIGLFSVVLADKLYWRIDPVGVVSLAIYTIINWTKTILENAVSLVGQPAPPEVLQKLTYLVIAHSPKIKRVNTLRAYTVGDLYFVAVHIELPEDLPLKEARDISEALQVKLKDLPEVERAFVHLDIECDHKP